MFPEAILYDDETLYVAYRDVAGLSHIAAFTTEGILLYEFDVPDYFKFLGDGFASLAIAPGGKTLYAATAQGLEDDETRYIRFIEFDCENLLPGAHLVYEPNNAVVGIVAMDTVGSFLVLERGADGDTYNVDLYYALTRDALDVQEIQALEAKELFTMTRKLVQSWTGVEKFDTIAAAPGSRHSWGDYNENDLKIIMMSNNAFVASDTVGVILDVEYNIIPVVKPTYETTSAIDTGDDRIATSPAIWVHPHDAALSLIFGTLYNGGIATYDLKGTLVSITEGKFWGIDVLHGFKMQDELIDIAILSDLDSANLRFFKIQDSYPYLVEMEVDVVSPGTTKHVSTYISPYTGKTFVLASFSNLVYQVELTIGANNTITNNINATRTLEISEDTNVEVVGMEVDRETGYIYVAMSEGGVLKFDAEDGEVQGFNSTMVVSDSVTYLDDQIFGMTMYYGVDGGGYLLVSVGGDSSFAVFDRSGENEYIGSFTVGSHDSGIDKTDSTRGIAVMNIPLGPEFSCGLLVTQDEDNEPTLVDTFAEETFIFNANTNFKLVAFEEIADALYTDVMADTNTWGPRRFSLALWADEMASDIYSQFTIGDISGRDAESLLSILSEAQYYVYASGTKRRSMLGVSRPSGESRRRLSQYGLKDPAERRVTHGMSRRLVGCPVVELEDDLEDGLEDVVKNMTEDVVKNMTEDIITADGSRRMGEQRRYTYSYNASSHDDAEAIASIEIGEEVAGEEVLEEEEEELVPAPYLLMDEFIDTLVNLSLSQRLNKVNVTKISGWKNMAASIRDALPMYGYPEERR